MKNTLSFLLSFCAAGAFAANVGHLATVSNVSFTQNGQQDVIVTYDLANNGEPAFVTLDVLTNGVPLPVAAVQSLSGDVSTSLTNFVADGNGKSITWKARADWKGNLSTNASVLVSAHYTNHLEGVYLRVDVTGGTTAESWPYHFGAVEPDITSKAFLWDELWLKCVPAGTFLMGSPEDELGRGTDETQHLVTISKPFFIGITPVTRKQWTNMGGSMETGSQELAVEGYESCAAGNLRYTHSDNANKNRVDKMVATLASKTGLVGFALPTEAQWEYACRADTQGVWADGSPWDPGTTTSTYAVSTNLYNLAWYQNNAGTKIDGKQVATKAPNAWGLYDLHGNVWELCRDKKRNYTADDVTDPCGGIPTSSEACVKRGGSKDTPANGCRAARRNTNGTTGTQATNGARLVLEF